MKVHLLAASALLLGALSPVSAKPSAKEPSTISSYAGHHNGTLIVSGSAAGTTTGNFRASKKKDTGKLTLSSTVAQSGTTFLLSEQFTFNKRKVSYIFTESFGGSSIVGVGSGTAKIRKNTITYSLVFIANGTAIPVQGTIRLAKNHHITITETLTVSGSPLVLIYQLGGKKPKK